jgi:hypothetical protein
MRPRSESDLVALIARDDVEDDRRVATKPPDLKIGETR